MKKSPRDFVHIDEFWKGDSSWASYFIGDKVWVYYDEYNPGLIGDEDYCRIVVHAGNGNGLIYKRPLSDRPLVDEVLRSMEQPVSEQQLVDLGFQWWRGDYDEFRFCREL